MVRVVVHGSSGWYPGVWGGTGQWCGSWWYPVVRVRVQSWPLFGSILPYLATVWLGLLYWATVVVLAESSVVSWQSPRWCAGRGLPGYQARAYALEVLAVCGIVFTASASSLVNQNGDSSRNDLADLSVLRPR